VIGLSDDSLSALLYTISGRKLIPFVVKVYTRTVDAVVLAVLTYGKIYFYLNEIYGTAHQYRKCDWKAS
jgi:hypothetical protein